MKITATHSFFPVSLSFFFFLLGYQQATGVTDYHHGNTLEIPPGGRSDKSFGLSQLVSLYGHASVHYKSKIKTREKTIG